LGETTLGALARAMTNKLGVKILSPEFEILLSLYDHGGFTAGELQLKSSASASAFYARLKLLIGSGTVRLDKGTADRRISFYTLAPATRRILDEALHVIDGWVEAKTEATGAQAIAFNRHLAQVSNQLDLCLFSTEFTIVMNVYDGEPIATSDLFYRSRAVNSRFYAALTLLAAQRTIRSFIDPDDRRRRIYCLPRGVRMQIDEVLREFRVIRPQPELV